MEEALALRGADIVQGARQDLLAELRGHLQTILDVALLVSKGVPCLFHDQCAESHGRRLHHHRALLGFLQAPETFAARHVGICQAERTPPASEAIFDFLNFPAAVGWMHIDKTITAYNSSPHSNLIPSLPASQDVGCP